MGRAVPPDATTIWQITLVAINPVPAFVKVDVAKAKNTASGIRYEVIKEGAGASPKATDQVTVHYTGWLTDGKLFDSSHARGETASFGLDQVIPGWSEAVQLMKVGGSARFLIPAKLAYGERSPEGSGIPANADLIFWIELQSIDQ
ncbi:MAG: FKBP-type peptidyl-prolyl cis-trans isomerase [Armatimonadetes bacterium]|nr:FKBP-type peptidyl-prolyl cis-trans isomerase [Armatimonadota bacterium]